MQRQRRVRATAIVAAALVISGLSLAATAGSPAIAAADAKPPAVVAPVVRIRSGAVGASRVPFTVSWAGTDASGIARYKLQLRLDGGSWQTVALPAPAARSVGVGLRPPHEYRFRVRATDRAGNTGSWAYGTTIRVRLLGERTSALSTAGTWSLVRGTGYLGGRALRSRVAESAATFTFTGSQVAWIATRAPGRGTARVYLDGALVTSVDLHRAVTMYRRIVFRRTWAASRAHTLTIQVAGTAGTPAVDIDGFVVVDPPAPDPVLVGAGDVSTCASTWDSKTAALLDRIAGRVFVPGDLAYPGGTRAQFRDCYGPTWGRWRLRTSPAPGNHEYNSAGAAPYFAYFGARAGTAGKGWYAYDLGTWRIYSLNANCTRVGCGPGSAQVQWLRADLAAHARACVAAIWHQPLFSSGVHGNDPLVRPLWQALQDAGAEVVINGHDHDFERFAPQTATGVADPAGITEFVVGTGGASLRAIAAVQTNSVRRSASTHGVLKLTLRTGGYDWAFVPVAGQTFTDRGSASCH